MKTVTRPREHTTMKTIMVMMILMMMMIMIQYNTIQFNGDYDAIIMIIMITENGVMTI